MERIIAYAALALGLALPFVPVLAGNCAIPGQQDSTCITAISSAAIPPPSCGANQTQTSAPTWNGSSWVGLACQVVPPPPPPVKTVHLALYCTGLSGGLMYPVYDFTDPSNAIMYGVVFLEAWGAGCDGTPTQCQNLASFWSYAQTTNTGWMYFGKPPVGDGPIWFEFAQAGQNKGSWNLWFPLIPWTSY
jgi:hypothetical protein